MTAVVNATNPRLYDQSERGYVVNPQCFMELLELTSLLPAMQQFKSNGRHTGRQSYSPILLFLLHTSIPKFETINILATCLAS